MPTCYLMKKIFLQSLKKTRSIYVSPLIYISPRAAPVPWSNNDSSTSPTREGVRCVVSYPFIVQLQRGGKTPSARCVIANSGNRVDRLNRLFFRFPRSGPLCSRRSCSPDPTCHQLCAVMVGKGVGNWGTGYETSLCLSGRFRKCQEAFPWARTSTRIQGVVNRRFKSTIGN